MKLFLSAALFLLTASMLSKSAEACSSFACFDSDRPLYGMNFDWYPDAEILFNVETGEDGRRVFTMSYILEGSDPIPTVGMNSLGFFATMQVIDTDIGTGTPQDDEVMIWMPFYQGLWHLSEFSQVEAYLDSLKLVQYSEIPLHLMLADDQGSAMLVEVGEESNRIVELGSDPFIVMTNFSCFESINLEYTEVTGTGAARYVAAWEALETNAECLDVDGAMDVLHAALNHSDGFPTRVSMVFDPYDNSVYVALDGNLDKVWKITLEEGVVSSYRGLPDELSYPLPEGGISSFDLALRVEG
jgi:hypothetical protein